MQFLVISIVLNKIQTFNIYIIWFKQHFIMYKHNRIGNQAICLSKPSPKTYIIKS